MAQCSEFHGIGAGANEICRILIERELIKLTLPPQGRCWMQLGHCHL